MHRGNTHTAARDLRTILAHDDRPTTIYSTAEHTDMRELPTEISDLLGRNQHRRSERAAARKQHSETN